MIQEQRIDENGIYVKLSRQEGRQVSREEMCAIYASFAIKGWMQSWCAWREVARRLGLPEDMMVMNVDWKTGIVSHFGYRE